MLKKEPSKESTISPAVRFKAQAKRRAAAWQTERAHALESELQILQGDYLRVSADLKSAKKTIEEMRRSSTNVVMSSSTPSSPEKGDTKSNEFNELKGRWDRLLQDDDDDEEEEVIENTKFSDPDRSLFSKSSIRHVDEYLDEKKANHAMTFARKAAEMDKDDEKRRSNSFNRFPGIRSSSNRPTSSRRRHSGSSVGSLSNSRGDDDVRPRSRDIVDRRPRSSSSSRREDSKTLLPRVVSKRGMEGNKRRAFDSLISTPPGLCSEYVK